MVQISFIAIGLILLFLKKVPVTKSSELRRPRTIYLGIVLIVVGILMGSFGKTGQIRSEMLEIGLILVVLILILVLKQKKGELI